MKKIIIGSVAVVLSTFLLSGCSTNATPSHASGDAQAVDYIHFDKKINSKSMQKILKNVGESEGWRMTEYKNNAMIAEKISDAEAEAVTITFSKDFFYTNPRNRSLESAIKDALPKEEK